jgi:hypothetical protein
MRDEKKMFGANATQRERKEMESLFGATRTPRERAAMAKQAERRSSRKEKR